MHVDSDLSAYLDGELAPADRARVDGHLAGCGRCADRLRELRSTAALIAALPAMRPARSLVPRVSQRWDPLRPVRAISALASGAFLFLFLVTAVARGGAGLGGGAATTTASAPLAADAPAATDASRPAPLSTRAPAAVPAPAADGARQLVTAAPTAAAERAPAPKAAPPTLPTAASERRPADPLAEPMLWLALAILAALAAIVAHRRVRTS